MPRIILFTQQTLGLGARKTSMVFLAEAWARAGFDTHVVTTQLSWLTHLRRDNRLRAIPADRRNRWYAAEGLQGFVWVPPLHPVGSHRPGVSRLLEALVPLYGRELPAAIMERVAGADAVVIESCAAVALFPALKQSAPHARFLYSMSDRLDVVGMNSGLHKLLRATAPAYDLVRVPAKALLGDLPGAHAVHIPHGLDTRAFDQPLPSPYSGGGANAVLIGDMMLDVSLLCQLAHAFPQVRFHLFGRAEVMDRPGNLIAWGEQPFSRLVAFIQHADVGLSLYRPSEALDYLAESSLKNIQYAYCGLPIVAPAFVADGEKPVISYDPERPDSAREAFARALARGRRPIGAFPVADWDAVAARMLREAGPPLLA